MLKNTAFILLTLIAAASASCRKTSIPQEEATVGISFNTSVRTRAAIEDITGLQHACTAESSGGDGQSIGIYGVMSRENPSDIREIFSNDALSYSTTDGAWTYGLTKYWISQYEYSFWAVYPYSSQPDAGAADPVQPCYSLDAGKDPATGLSDYSLNISGYEITSENLRTDLMLGASYRDQRSGTDPSAVPITLRHALAAVNFRIRNGAQSKVLSVGNLMFGGMKYGCDVAMSAALSSDTDGSLAVSSDSYSEIYPADASSPYSASQNNPLFTVPDGGLDPDLTESGYRDLFRDGTVFVVPQRVVKASTSSRDISMSFDVEYEDDNKRTYNVSLSSNTTSETEEWLPGKKYTYNITLTENRIIFNVVVADWIDDIVNLGENTVSGLND